jgi:hypothetical protein
MLNEVSRQEGVWGVEVQLHAILTSARDGGEWSASCCGRFEPVRLGGPQSWCGSRSSPLAVSPNQMYIRGCIQKFPNWPPGARTANGTALCS